MDIIIENKNSYSVINKICTFLLNKFLAFDIVMNIILYNICAKTLFSIENIPNELKLGKDNFDQFCLLYTL